MHKHRIAQISSYVLFFWEHTSKLMYMQTHRFRSSYLFFGGNHGEQSPPTPIFVLSLLYWNSNMLWIFHFIETNVTFLANSSGSLFFFWKPRQLIASLKFSKYVMFWDIQGILRVRQWVHKSKLSYIIKFLSPRKDSSRRFRVFQHRSGIEHGLMQQYICMGVWESESTTYLLCACMNNSLYSVWTLTMQDSIIESKTINYIVFMVFCWCGSIFIEERDRKNKTSSLI